MVSAKSMVVLMSTISLMVREGSILLRYLSEGVSSEVVEQEA